MSYRSIHLQLSPHPAPTPTATIDYACALAHMFEAKLQVSSPRLKVVAPAHFLAGKMLAEFAAGIEQKTTAKTAELESHLTQRAAALGLGLQLTEVAETWPTGGIARAWRGRTSDLCILGLSQENIEHRLEVEDWLFGVGRPCLLHPEKSPQDFSLDNVLVSWDFSKSAARAVADSLPLMRRAKQVRIVTIRGEKDMVKDVKTPILEFLATHSLTAVADEIELEGRTIGDAILEHANRKRANLIVMGAFGHSRVREFLLGGATKGLLETSTIPLLMSH